MDEFEEENSRNNEKKAFYVGLGTIAFLVVLIVLVTFFIRGCSEKGQTIEEVKDEAAVTQEAAVPIEGNVAGTVSSPAVTPVLSASPTAKGTSYIVKSGDTLFELGLKFKVDWKKIAEANGIDNSAALKVGKEIIIPAE